MHKPIFKTPYDGEDHRVRKHIIDESLAKQSFADECNINLIMARYEKTSILDHVNKYNGNYESYENVQDYHSALCQVINARQAFDDLPSKIRARFNNDPGQFLAYANNPDNKPGMKELGLMPEDTPIPEGSDPKDQATDSPTNTSSGPTEA